jgi:diaminopropionate ammonia-lyase
MAAPRAHYSENRFRRRPVSAELLPAATPDASAFHQALPGYQPTPLVGMPALARELGVGAVWVKDESKRFGLNAFKVLGASYAIFRFLKSRAPGLSAAHFLDPETRKQIPSLTFTTATDGNHGRAVAWTAAKLGQKAVIYVPGNTVRARIAALEGEGADVVVVDGTYDDTVKRAASDAQTHGRQVISDTAWEGYTEIPRWIMEGYETLFAEVDAQRRQRGASAAPAAVFLQAGVGGMAYAGACHYRRLGDTARLVCVEPVDADCLLESIRSPDGSAQVSKGKQDSIMAGLNCGTPSLVAWPLLREALDGFLAVDDEYARQAMRRLAKGGGGDPHLTSGESGAAGLAGLLAFAGEPGLTRAREGLGLGAGADIVLISTEGATDPDSYGRIVGQG